MNFCEHRTKNRHLGGKKQKGTCVFKKAEEGWHSDMRLSTRKGGDFLGKQKKKGGTPFSDTAEKSTTRREIRRKKGERCTKNEGK